jgi:hypothetical protein
VPEGRRNLESVRAAVAAIFELRRQISGRNQGKPNSLLRKSRPGLGRDGVERELASTASSFMRPTTSNLRCAGHCRLRHATRP